MMQVFGDNCKFKSAVICGILPLVLREGLCFWGGLGCVFFC